MSQRDPFGPETSEPEKFDAYQEPQFGAPAERKGPGCLFWGCLISGILFVVTLVLVIALVVFFRNWAIGKINEYTEDRPVALPEIQLTDEQRQEVIGRWEAFREAMDEGRAAELALDDDELNVVAGQIAPEAADTVRFEIEGDRLRGQVSLPVEELGRKLLGTNQLDGRYFNASGTFDVFLRNGVLVLQIQEAEVKGEPVPDEIMDQVRGQNLAEEMNRDPERRALFSKFESIEVKDGRVVFKARGTAEPEPAAEPEAAAEPEPAAEPEAAAEPEPAAEPEATAEPEAPGTAEPAPPIEPDAPEPGQEDPSAEPEDSPEPAEAPSEPGPAR